QPVRIQIVEGEIAQAAQVWIRVIESLAGQTIGGHPGEGDLRMHVQEAQEFRPHVAAGARDRDADLAHRPRAYRFEYWNFWRAPGWPYFLRSRIRGSRVRSPAFLSGSRSLSSNRASARAMPWRTAPAWPVGPPPPTVAITSNCPTVFVTWRGCAMNI